MKSVHNIRYYVTNKEIQDMTENETILINLIRQHKNPEQALLTAIQVILWSLDHPEESASKSVVASLEFVETNQALLSRFL